MRGALGVDAGRCRGEPTHCVHDVLAEQRGAVVAIGRHALERPIENPLQFGWPVRVREHIAEPHRVVGEPLDHGFLCAICLERQSAGEHAEEHQRKRIDVAATVQHVAGELLGTHVFRRTDHEAGLSDLLSFLPRHRLCDAEVHDLDDVVAAAAGCDHDVVGLEIPVDDPEIVSRLERFGCLL